MINEIAVVLRVRSQIQAITLADHADTLRERSPYSEAINRHIRSGDELDLYMNFELREAVTTRSVLIADIDPQYRGATGEPNIMRMLQGKAPYDHQTGSVIDLHHIGQKYDSPFAELPHSIHDAPGINSTLHSSKATSWRNDPKLVADFQSEAKRHWKERGEELCRFCPMSTTMRILQTCTRPCSNRESFF